MKNTIIKNLGILLAGFIIGIAVSAFIFNTPSALNNSSVPASLDEESSGNIKASLLIDFGNGKITTCNNRELENGKTVFDFLMDCSQTVENPFEVKYKDYPDFGVFIEQIGGVGGAGESYWQYWVNNEYSQAGASQRQLNNNDIIEWKFIKGQL